MKRMDKKCSSIIKNIYKKEHIKMEIYKNYNNNETSL